MRQDTLVAEARSALTTGEARKALDLVAKALEDGARDVRLHKIAANASAALRLPAEAIRHYRAALALAPSDTASWGKLAALVRRHEGPEAAVGVLGNALAVQPADIPLRRLMADNLQAAGRPEEALGFLAQDESPDGQRARAAFLLDSTRYGEAEALYASLLAAVPGERAAMEGLARCAQFQRDWPLAIARWRSLVDAAGPEEFAPRIQLASCLRISGAHAEAEREIQIAMAIQEQHGARRFWGGDGVPHPEATQLAVEERITRALADQERCLVRPGSPYHPSVPAASDALFAAEVEGRASSVLQYASEAKFLARFLAHHRVESFFEVGMRFGSFSRLLREAVGLKRMGGSEFEITPKLRELMADPGYEIYAGDHYAQTYVDWRLARAPFEFVFIDGAHGYNDVMRDYLREVRFRPRFIGFHDIWNIGALGAKRQFDELGGKVAYYCNESPDEYMMIRHADRRQAANHYDQLRSNSGYSLGIGIIELENPARG